jgi:YjbE family integral membrane protein
MIDAAAWLFLLLQIFFVDLLLGADNAIVIALACRRLPPEGTRRAVLLGAVGAIVLRLVMILFANAMLGVPLVKLVGAWMLVVIALNVKAQNGDDDGRTFRSAGSAGDFVSAAAVIMLADAAMSLDNVVALAAIAGGSFWLLAIGVLISIPIVAYGALILTALIRRAPEIITVGVAFLGWIAGAMAVSDPLVAGWVQANAPALAIFAPALVALFVLSTGGRTIPKQARPAGIEAKASAARARTRAPSPQRHSVAIPRTAPQSTPPDRELPSPAVPQPATPLEDPPPVFAMNGPTASARGWTEERLVVAGFVLLALIAGLIIFFASFFDSLT